MHFAALETDATVRGFRRRVRAYFDGFGDDPREIDEMPEIRRYCAELDVNCPYWLRSLSAEDVPPQTVASSLGLRHTVSFG